MLLRKLFGRKTRLRGAEQKIENLKEKKVEAHTTQEPEEPPKHTNVNLVYPFYDVKATSFPPPLSLDASVYTDLQKEKQVPVENQVPEEKQVPEENEDKKKKQNEIIDETKNGEKIDSIAKLPCDLQTCTKVKCSPQTCETSLKGSLKYEAEDKIISPTKLTAIINSSIKEAMEIIVKQCRMDEKKNVAKKRGEGAAKSVCRESKKVVPVKIERESPKHAVQELNNRLKTCRSSRFQKKHINYRLHSKKFCEENAKGRNKKGTVCDQGKKKKHLKPANNVKTDNRRMTGNVNIYICSEANENAQATVKQKKPEPCTESSSESTTEQSRISSSKLVTCIRNKRRKSKEQNSLDYLPKREDDDSEGSTTCTSKYIDTNSTEKLQSDSFIDVCYAGDKNICVKNAVSVLTDCKCKDVNISNVDVELEKSDSSIEEPKFVICDKIEKPCATIYTTKSLSNSESDGWSSKSTGSSQNTDSIPSDNWSLEPNVHDFDNEDENHRTSKRRLGNAYKYRKRDRDTIGKYSIRCNCKNKKHFSKAMEKESTVQPWSTCNCIAEEEEEDVESKSQESGRLSQDGEGKITVCQKTSEDLDERTQRIPSTEYDADFTESPKDLEEAMPERVEISEQDKQVKISEEVAEKGAVLSRTERKLKDEPKVQQIPSVQETTQQPTQMGIQQGRPMFIKGRLVRPEVLLLKNILKQQAPGTDQANVSPQSKAANVLEEPTKHGTEPKTEAQVSPDILKKYNMRDLHRYQKQTILEGKEMVPPGKEEEKISEEKDSGKDKDTKSFKAWLKETFLSKCLRKVIGTSEDPKTKPEKYIAEDNIAESTPADITTDKNVEILRNEIDGNQLPEKSTVEIKGAFRERNKSEYPNTSSATQPKAMENVKELATNSTTVIVQHEGIENYENKTPTSDAVKRKSLTFPSQHPHTELTKEIKSEKCIKLSDSLNTKKDANRGRSKRLEFQDRRECQTIRMQNENQDRVMQLDVHSDTESITVCGQFSSEKLPTKEVKQSQPYKSEPHTVCINSKYTKHPGTNEYFINEENSSNCGCLPVSQSSNEVVNYPKSCLKKDRQCCCVCAQENNCSITYQDKRHWKECGCRRIVLCNGCCRPKNECSCRIPISCPNCYKPKNKCNCKAVQEVKNSCACMKSMFCLYCDNPRDKCTCRASVRKCTCCKLSMDLCTCKDQKTICDGRPVLTEPDNDRIMYVTAWKPREEVRRYFSRNLTDLQTDSISECCCCEKIKPHKSNDLPYQRLSVFSDVMDELQHKISESTCCTRCRKIPCCCNIKIDRDEGREERMIKYCVSPKKRRKIIAVCVNKSSSKLSNNCKCDPNQTRGDKPNKIIVPLYCVCKATPCKCRKSKTNQKKPKAKCYYCKSSPCICIASRERNKLRPCRCTDSPCRTKEKDSVPCGKTSTKSKNNDEKPICVR